MGRCLGSPGLRSPERCHLSAVVGPQAACQPLSPAPRPPAGEMLWPHSSGGGRSWAEPVWGGEQRPGPTAMDPEMGVTTSLFPTRNPAETFTTLLPVRNVVRFIRRHPLCFVLLPEYSHPQSPSEALGTKDDPQRATGSSDSLLILPLY